MVKEFRKVGGNLNFKGGGDVIIVGIQSSEQEKSQNLLYPTDSSSCSMELIVRQSLDELLCIAHVLEHILDV
jgi:hypothetical protein